MLNLALHSLKIIILLLFFTGSFKLYSANITSAATGNWSSSAWPNTTRTGTITTSTSSATVTGSGTSFLNEISVGTVIKTTGNAVIGTVAAVNSATSLTLQANAASTNTNISFNSQGVGPTDVVTIGAGNTVTLNGNYTCAGLVFSAGSANAVLTHSSAFQLTVNGTVNLAQPGLTGVTNSWNINAGSANVSGLITFSGLSVLTTNAQLVITSGTLNANGGLTFTTPTAAVKTIDMTGGAGTINLTGALTGSSNGILNAGTSGSVFNYTGSTAQTIGFFGSGAYHNLYINNTNASGASLGTSITTSNVTGNLAVGNLTSGSLLAVSATAIAMNASRSVTVAAGSTMNAGTAVISFGTSGSVVMNGTFNTANLSGFSGNTSAAISSTNNPSVTLGTASLVIYSGAAQTVSARTDYATITLSVAGNKTLAGNATLSGNMNVNAGPLLITSNTLTIGGSLTGTGAVTSTTGTINLAGDFSNSGTFTAGTGTVHYNGTVPQSVRGATYYSLTFSNSGLKTFAGAIAITAGATLLVNAGATVDAGVNQITATGATATITINGTLRTSDLDGLWGATNTTISSTNTALTPFVTTSTIEYAASTGTQFVSLITPDSIYGNLIMSGGGTKQPNQSFKMLPGTTFTLNAGVNFFNGTRNIQNSAGTGNVTFNINGIFITGLQNGFSGGTTAINSLGTTINLGSTSVIHYSRSTGAQTFSARSDYVTVRISGATTKTMNGNVTVSDSLNIIDGDLSLNGNTLTVNGRIAGLLRGSSSSNLVIGGTAVNAPLSFIQTSSATRSLNAFTLNRSAGATLNSAMDVAGAFTLTNGPLVLNGQALTLNGTTSYTSGTITGSTSSNIEVGGTGSLGLLTFTTGSQTLNNLTLNRTSSGNASLGSSLAISGALTFTNGRLNLGSHTLTLNGTLSGMNANNAFTSNGSSVLSIAGSGTLGSSLFFDQANAGTSNRLLNLTYNRSSQTITLGNALEVTGTVTPTAGTLASGGNLTLISNASGTGRIAAGTGTYITGTVNVQRFIPAVARRWRFMSSPVSNATLEDWRNEFYITGAGTGNTIGALNSNGFDATQNNQAGVYTYNESASGVADVGWTPVTNSTPSLTSVSLVPGRGYRVFIRGDRSDLTRLQDLNLTQNQVTADLKGTVNTGDITMPVSYTNTGNGTNDGWCLVGNPYPSQYDWNAFWDAGNSGNSGTYYTNVSPIIYVYDPVSNSYTSYNALSNSGTLTSGLVAQGQSFFITTTASSPAMTFKEQFKTAATPLALFKTSEPQDEMKIRIERDSINYDDYLLKYISAATRDFDRYDILKVSGTTSLSSYASDRVLMALDCRPDIALDTVMLNVTGSVGELRLVFTSMPSNDSKYYYLIDSYLKTFNAVGPGSVYPFSITADVVTKGSERFKLIISEEPLMPAALDDLQQGKQYSDVWPNPTKGDVNIMPYDPLSLSTIRLFTLEGKLVADNTAGKVYPGSPLQVNFSGLTPGLYFLRLQYHNGNSETIKLLIE